MPVTTVAAQGTAETEYDLVTFTLSLSETASTVPAAKARLQLKVERLDESLTQLCQKLNLEFVKNSVRKGSSVHEKYNYDRNANENRFVGYEMQYTMSFQVSDMELVNDVYDALTSLPEVRVNNPSFSLKNHDRLNRKALKRAWEKVEERFESECEVLGLDPADFVADSWETNYSDSQRNDRLAARGAMAYAEGAVGAAAPAGGAGPRQLDIVSGLAVVTVNLEVAYVRKANTTPSVKATVVERGHGTVSGLLAG